MTSASRICLAGNQTQRTHPGRPETEEPHIKKTMKNKKEITEYICKVDQDELGILEDEFDDLKDLFKVVYDGFTCYMVMQINHLCRCSISIKMEF